MSPPARGQALARCLLYLSGEALIRTPEDVMRSHSSVARWIKRGLLATLLLSTATAAFADHGGRRRFKGVDECFVPQRVIIRERSSAAPAIAGLIGGFLLGTAVSSSAQPVIVHERHYCSPPVVVYRYYDPYEDYWYDSLDECRFHYGHPRIIQVIDVRSGHVVRALRFHDGCWQRLDDDEDFDD